jgi:hypothetical protein
MAAAPAGPARIILDANILVSAVIASGRASGSALGQTVDRALEGAAIVIACPRLLSEVEDALRSRRLSTWVHADVLIWGGPAPRDPALRPPRVLRLERTPARV